MAAHRRADEAYAEYVSSPTPDGMALMALSCVVVLHLLHMYALRCAWAYGSAPVAAAVRHLHHLSVNTLAQKAAGRVVGR
jgi:histidinol-phosphate/aromatic aminotransferase/cobyric acid decarboxylase-like protein